MHSVLLSIQVLATAVFTALGKDTFLKGGVSATPKVVYVAPSLPHGTSALAECFYPVISAT